MTALNPEIDAGLLRYLAVRDQARADQVNARLARFEGREQLLVREAAVMGYVLGYMAGEVAGRRGDPPNERRIPPDSRIVAEVLLGCASQSDLYPLIGEAVPDDPTHGEIAADRCLNCNRPLVRRNGKLVHREGDPNRCMPPASNKEGTLNAE